MHFPIASQHHSREKLPLEVRSYPYRMHLSSTLNPRELVGKRGEAFSVDDQVVRFGSRFLSSRSTFNENFNYFAVSCPKCIKEFYQPVLKHTV